MTATWVVRVFQGKEHLKNSFSDESKAKKYYADEVEKDLPQGCNDWNSYLETGEREILMHHGIAKNENGKLAKYKFPVVQI